MSTYKFLDVEGVKHLWQEFKKTFATKAEVPSKMSELYNDMGYRTTDQRGETGPFYLPYVDEDGNISWSNNGGLANPETRSIKGPKGDNADGGYETEVLIGTASNNSFILKENEINYITITLGSDALLGKLLKCVINNDSRLEAVSIVNVNAVMDGNGQLSAGTVRLNLCNPTTDNVVIPANTGFALTYAKGLAVGTLETINNKINSNTSNITRIEEKSDNNDSNLQSQIDALAANTKITMSASPSIIYKNIGTNVTLNSTFNSDSDITPATLKILDGSTVIVSGTNKKTISSIVALNLTADKKYTSEGVYKSMTVYGNLTVQARYPIYYGFGANASAIAVSANMVSPTTTAARTYTKTASANNQHFYILVPSDINGLSSFTMGGAPFVMNTVRNETINGIVYKVYESGNVYNNGTQLSVAAS